MPASEVPSPVHRSLIEAASTRPDACFVPPERVRGRARRLLGEKLVALGVAETITLPDSDGPITWWVEGDRGAIGLRLAPTRRQELPFTPEAPQLTQIVEPRGWTKIAWVLALLRRAEGADLQAIVAATGWLPHTARAALTGLRRRGHAIEARRDGEARGRTIYRIGAPSNGTAPTAEKKSLLPPSPAADGGV